MEKIVLIGLFLFIGMVYDIRFKQIPSIIFVVFGAIAAVETAVGIWGNQWEALAGGAPGLLLLLVSRISREQIGYGDSLAFLIVGALSGPEDIVYMILLAFLAASAVSGILFMIKRVDRNYCIPFFPMIFIAYLFRYIKVI